MADTDGIRADWRLAEEPAPEDEVVHILVREGRLASGHGASGRIIVGVAETDFSIELDVRVIPLRGDQTAPRNPETPFEVRLGAPVGRRRIVDRTHT